MIDDSNALRAKWERLHAERDNTGQRVVNACIVLSVVIAITILCTILW